MESKKDLDLLSLAALVAVAAVGLNVEDVVDPLTLAADSGCLRFQALYPQRP